MRSQDPELSLYIAGGARRQVAAIDTIRRACAERFGANFRVRVIDVQRDPAAAERENILATPTLVMRSAGGARRLIGDLSNEAAIERWLRSH